MTPYAKHAARYASGASAGEKAVAYALLDVAAAIRGDSDKPERTERRVVIELDGNQVRGVMRNVWHDGGWS